MSYENVDIAMACFVPRFGEKLNENLERNLNGHQFSISWKKKKVVTIWMPLSNHNRTNNIVDHDPEIHVYSHQDNSTTVFIEDSRDLSFAFTNEIIRSTNFLNF
jgi:hypothetical protein